MEYLLDRQIITIDYLIISHFDSDHSGKAVDLIETLNVKNIVISKQTEKSQEFENVMREVKKHRVKIIQVEAGDVIKIEKDIYFEILWPNSNCIIKDNPLNNNSIVAKLNYKNNFSMLFTGDIEEKAENEIVKKYNTDKLNATILKVAHHGSKTSSTEMLIKKVNPKISLIGVGENNKFGHPNINILERLYLYGSQIYRTDLQGEITIKINKNGRIRVNTHL